jgi:hypothetical protein
LGFCAPRLVGGTKETLPAGPMTCSIFDCRGS